MADETEIRRQTRPAPRGTGDTGHAGPGRATAGDRREQGPHDALTDVPGMRVGHAQRADDGWLTGTTVVLAPQGGAVAAVDVRGGGPGTRETDALDPRNVVQRVDAVVLTGGSAFGLDAATGVASWLEEQGRGVPVGPDPAQVVPVVPAACLFDLGRGGDWRARPDAALGRAAAEDARASGSAVAQGNVGAGTGAVTAGLKGGVGTASTRLSSGPTVAALAVVNAVGTVLDPESGVLYGELFAGRYAPPAPERHTAARERLERARAALGMPPLNTTLAVIATDAALTKAQAQKLAGCAHDGLARAIRPAHLMHDGDTVFALSAGRREPAGPAELNAILAAGADTLTRAIVKAVLAAETVSTAHGEIPAYRDLYDRA